MEKKQNKRDVAPILSLRQMLTDAAVQAPQHIAYRYKKNGEIADVTNAQLYESVESLGAALCAMGYGSVHIACVAENSYPWIQTYLSVLLSAGVFVPLDKDLDPDTLIYLLTESDARVVFCDEKRRKTLSARRGELPAVEKFVVLDAGEDEGDFLSFSRLLAWGQAQPRAPYDALRSDPQECKEIVYTSGTTGAAKGVMLTEHNLISSVYYGLGVSGIFGTGLSVLPYHHTYEGVCDLLVSIHARTTLCINDSLRHVQNNLKLFKPDYIYLVPAFAERFYDVIWAAVAKKKKTGVFRFLLSFSDFLRKIGLDCRRRLFRSVLDEFGGNLTRIVCGGAPIRPQVGEFFDRIGITLTGGYGITECSPLVSVTDDEHAHCFWSAGSRLACLEWKIENPDSEGRGEICVRGDVVFKGYYKRPDLTEASVRDGWFFTGDYGYITEEDLIVITGRKKNIIVLSNGKNIYPEELENKIGNLPYVSEVVVDGVKNKHGQDTSLRATLYCAEGHPGEKEVEADIADALSALPVYKQIGILAFRDEPFPKTSTNKIRRI